MCSPKNQYICRLLNSLLKLLLFVPQREMVRVQHDVFIDLPPESQLLSKHPLHVNTHTDTHIHWHHCQVEVKLRRSSIRNDHVRRERCVCAMRLCCVCSVPLPFCLGRKWMKTRT